MNNIFEKNIQALSAKDSELAGKLVKHTLTEVPQLVNENGFYNLVYKNTPLHNPLNPLEEAKEIFARSENTPDAIHLIYGIGLGYLFQVASATSVGNVILYEPNLDILRITFSLVDFSNDILKKNVFISTTLEKMGEYIYKKSNTKNSPIMLSTTGYRTLNESQFSQMVEELQRMIGSYSLDLKYTQEKFLPLIKDIIRNIPQLTKEVPLSTIKNCYKGKTAVVVSAGPTLDKNIETIKKYRDNIILIVVGTAMKALAAHNIKPDFLCIIEAYDSSKQIADIDLSDINFITEPYSNKNIRKFNFKQIFSHMSCNMPLNKFWSNVIGEDNADYISKGTVSYTALNTARLLGCSKIVLVGQDLAYIEGQCYSKESAYKDLECRFNQETDKWEIIAKNLDDFANALSNAPNFEQRKAIAINRLKNLNNSLYYVKGINGKQIPTESVYAAFIKPLSEFTKAFNEIEYINTSLVGAQIDGYKNMPLEDALKNSVPITNRNLKINYNLDIEKVKERLQNEIKQLENTKQNVESGKNALKALNNDFKRYRNVTVEVLKSLKKVSAIFLDLSSANTETLFDFITAADKINVDYSMKMAQNFNMEIMSDLIDKFTKYFGNAEKNTNDVIQLLKKATEDIS